MFAEDPNVDFYNELAVYLEAADAENWSNKAKGDLIKYCIQEWAETAALEDKRAMKNFFHILNDY